MHRREFTVDLDVAEVIERRIEAAMEHGTPLPVHLEGKKKPSFWAIPTWQYTTATDKDDSEHAVSVEFYSVFDQFGNLYHVEEDPVTGTVDHSLRIQVGRFWAKRIKAAALRGRRAAYEWPRIERTRRDYMAAIKAVADGWDKTISLIDISEHVSVANLGSRIRGKSVVAIIESLDDGRFYSWHLSGSSRVRLAGTKDSACKAAIGEVKSILSGLIREMSIEAGVKTRIHESPEGKE